VSRDIVDQPSPLKVAGVDNYVNVLYGTFDLFLFLTLNNSFSPSTYEAMYDVLKIETAENL
jgi:hypothetical protein